MRRSSYLNPVLFVTGLALVAFLLLQCAFNEPYNHDENQYIVPSFFAVDHTLYRDFIYLQPPYFPLLHAALFSLLDGRYFLAARLAAFCFSFGSFCLVLSLSYRITRDRVAAFAFAVLFITSEIVAGAAGSARNDIMPCFFSLFGIYLFYLAQNRTGGRAVMAFLGGLALAVAVGTKLSYAFAPLGVVLYALILRRDRLQGHFRNVTLPLMIGGIVGSLPIVFYAMTAFNNFVYGVITFHTEATPFWYQNYKSQAHLTWLHRAWALVRFLLRDGTASFAIIFALAASGAICARDSLKRLYSSFHRHHGFLFLFLLVLAVPLAVTIRASYLHYFIPIVLYLLLTVAALYASIREIIAGIARPLLLGGTIVVMAPGLFFLAKTAAAPSVVANVHSIAMEIRDGVRDAGIPGNVATLSPVFVIDAGLPVYREFTTGPFFFRTGDMLTPQQVRALNGVSPNTLESLLDKDPPAAVFVGYEAHRKFPLDARLESYARRRGYVKADGAFGKGTLYIRPLPKN